MQKLVNLFTILGILISTVLTADGYAFSVKTKYHTKTTVLSTFENPYSSFADAARVASKAEFESMLSQITSDGLSGNLLFSKMANFKRYRQESEISKGKHFISGSPSIPIEPSALSVDSIATSIPTVETLSIPIISGLPKATVTQPTFESRRSSVIPCNRGSPRFPVTVSASTTHNAETIAASLSGSGVSLNANIVATSLPAVTVSDNLFIREKALFSSVELKGRTTIRSDTGIAAISVNKISIPSHPKESLAWSMDIIAPLIKSAPLVPSLSPATATTTAPATVYVPSNGIKGIDAGVFVDRDSRKPVRIGLRTPIHTVAQIADPLLAWDGEARKTVLRPLLCRAALLRVISLARKVAVKLAAAISIFRRDLVYLKS